MRPWQVWIVEDDKNTRTYLSEQVLAHAQLELVVAHAYKQEALNWMAHYNDTVDVLLCDLGLPDGSGLEVIRQAQQMWPVCETMVISMFGDQSNVLASIEAGAVGYIHKDAEWGDVAQSILDMKAGAAPMSPMIARGVLTRFRQMSLLKSETEVALRTQDAGLSDTLGADLNLELNITPREIEVLNLIARGFSYAEIAQLQSRSVHTVQTHIKNLYRKLAVHSKSEAVYEAQRLGLLKDAHSAQ